MTISASGRSRSIEPRRRRTRRHLLAERRHALEVVDEIGVLAPDGEVAVDDDLPDRGVGEAGAAPHHAREERGAEHLAAGDRSR